VRVTLCPAEQHGIIKSEMRGGASAVLHIINLKAAHDWSRPMLVQERVRKPDRGLIAEDGKRAFPAAHMQ
jgi:hypothetical protein